ncbi:MAG: hypothetical protein K0U39_00600 [Alphaproteobacteria bacterium]|nr:hypothetical protein [Alphaproteobacteria bacterium]
MAKLQQPVAENSHQETYEEPDEFDLLLIELADEVIRTNAKWFTHNEVMKELGPEFYEKYKH